MNYDLFVIPFFTGLLLAALLPVLGAYLRLRDEWLAALAYAHVGAAGALAATVLTLPALPGGFVGAALAAVFKNLRGRQGGSPAAPALLLLGGWSAAVLLAANHPMAERLGHALFDGQLYFADLRQLLSVAVGCLLMAAVLRLLSRRLLLARLYPDFFRGRGLPEWPVRLGFDLASALMLALATMALGIMGAFALIFVPPWLAFRHAGDWRAALFRAALTGVLAYLAAFGLAMVFDQPFGPVLALILTALALIHPGK
jgi:zinc transport system permease protein